MEAAERAHKPPPERRGKKMPSWVPEAVRILTDYWENDSRKFTQDFEKQVPISEAAKFCVDVFDEIAPEGRIHLQTAMIREINRRRKILKQ